MQAHLYEVVTVFHLKRDVLYSVAMLYQVVAHLCGRWGRSWHWSHGSLTSTVSLWAPSSSRLGTLAEPDPLPIPEHHPP